MALVTVRVFLALVTAKGWGLYQLDINNAFLHGFLDEDVYLLPPQGYDKCKPGQVCKLTKSLYGLKQASRQWNLEFTKKLLAYGFEQSAHDHCLFIFTKNGCFVMLLVYVDDVLISGSNDDIISDIEGYLDSEFTIKDLGNAKYFLGLELFRCADGMLVTQKKYILDLLDDSGLNDCRPVSTPLCAGHKFDLLNDCSFSDPAKYRRLIGRLLYLNLTRPDISFSVQQLSQFVSSPMQSHWDAALHVLKYLAGTRQAGLVFPANNDLALSAFSDADWATCTVTRKSLTGFCVLLGGALVSWKSKKQPTVSKSSCEAEYRSLGATVSELQWLSYLLQDLQVTVQLPISLWCDNKAALHITENPVFHERTKHLEIDCHIVRNQFKKGFILPGHVSTTDQLADIFTKSLGGPRFRAILSKLGFLFNEAPT